MNTKTDGISSGLVTVAWMNKRNGFIAKEGGRDYQEPLIRLSDAEALIADLTKQRNENYAAYNKLNVEAGQLIAEKDVEIERLTRERDTEIARNRPLQSLIKAQEETKSILLAKANENKAAVATLDSERQANAELTEQVTTLTAALEAAKKAIEAVRRGEEEDSGLLRLAGYNRCTEALAAIDAALAKGDEK